MTTTTPHAPNMEWLLSEPLLDAALAQIKSLDQFHALQDSFAVAQEGGQTISASIKSKLATKAKQLHDSLVKGAAQTYLQESGLGALVDAKRKWDDVRKCVCSSACGHLFVLVFSLTNTHISLLLYRFHGRSPRRWQFHPHGLLHQP